MAPDMSHGIVRGLSTLNQSWFAAQMRQSKYNKKAKATKNADPIVIAFEALWYNSLQGHSK